jgi:hypothetical protein
MSSTALAKSKRNDPINPIHHHPIPPSSAVTEDHTRRRRNEQSENPIEMGKQAGKSRYGRQRTQQQSQQQVLLHSDESEKPKKQIESDQNGSNSKRVRSSKPKRRRPNVTNQIDGDDAVGTRDRDEKDRRFLKQVENWSSKEETESHLGLEAVPVVRSFSPPSLGDCCKTISDGRKTNQSFSFSTSTEREMERESFYFGRGFFFARGLCSWCAVMRHTCC